MLEKYKITPEYTVKDAIGVLDKNGGKVVFIVDKKDMLMGIFTQGDMRKYILKSNDLYQPIVVAMNPTPITFPSKDTALKARSQEQMVVYPVVNPEGQLIDAIFERDYTKKELDSNVLNEIPLVIMAGGKGTRLYPFTKILPKALIPVGDITITERIINKFCKFGCKEVYLILNYKANMIKSYFNDIEKKYTIHYIEEKEFQGTGGGLSLLKGFIHNTFILSNCDILIDDDLECIYKTHRINNNQITFVCAMKNISIPYGVIDTDINGKIVNLIEKPEFSFLTNTGVYMIEPEIINSINENEFIHFPDVAKRCMDNGGKVGVFPISEKSWLDMGKFSEMEVMMKQLEIRGEI